MLLQLMNFQIELNDTIGLTLFWHTDFDSQLVKFHVQFENKNIEKYDFRWFAIGFSDYGELNQADLCFMWQDEQEKEHFQVIIMRIQDIFIIF